MTSFAAASPAAVNAERTAIVLGFATLALALAIFASCRTFASLLARLGIKNLSQNHAYRIFSKYHLYYWWSFGVLLVAHVMMATTHTGLPHAGDPDAGIHWIILAFGACSALAGATLFSSCRISPRLLSHTISEVSFANKGYRSFFRYHSYYWWFFVSLVAAHFAAGYLHAGFWPGAG